MGPIHKQALRDVLFLQPGDPGWQIVDGPLPIFSKSDPLTQLRTLMDNFCWYGRLKSDWGCNRTKGSYPAR
jgi:hypothetical protein